MVVLTDHSELLIIFDTLHFSTMYQIDIEVHKITIFLFINHLPFTIFFQTNQSSQFLKDIEINGLIDWVHLQKLDHLFQPFLFNLLDDNLVLHFSQSNHNTILAGQIHHLVLLVSLDLQIAYHIVYIDRFHIPVFQYPDFPFRSETTE